MGKDDEGSKAKGGENQEATGEKQAPEDQERKAGDRAPKTTGEARKAAEEERKAGQEERKVADEERRTADEAEVAEELGTEHAPEDRRGRLPFPVVGLGASAGGLEALEDFFEHVAPDAGMAYVVVTHLRPGQPSMMPDILSRKATIPVHEVTRAVSIEPNQVYVAPPGKNLAIMNGVLQPMAPASTAAPLPIDYLFRSLAQDQKEGAIGIILSGAGTDGTLGIKEIKGALGLVMVQQEESARYPAMPHSAIATEMVDLVLPASKMPGRLAAYARDARLLKPGAPQRKPSRLPEEPLSQLLVMLRDRTGHDFSQYKKSTVQRRIERRMNLHHLESVRHYVEFMQEHPEETDRLFKELLIGVTSFFRDPEAFESLRARLEQRFADFPASRSLRAWVPGCSTGEEAYSVAILLREVFDALKRRPSIQIFATDLDEEAIDVARRGLYPLGIASDVGEGRIERFFTKVEEAYQVRKEIREMIVFAPQNLIADPPFTRLDLVSCRNLLIYLQPSLQERLIPMFHYALNPGGLLFLGSSETIGSNSHLFNTLDKKWKVFERVEVPERVFVPDIGVAPPIRTHEIPIPEARHRAARLPETSAEQMLMDHLVPPTILMRERGDIIHIHGRTGEYLELSPGPQPVSNVYNMVRPGLELELAAAVRQAGTREGEIVRPNVRVKTNGDTALVNLRVRKVKEPDRFRGLFLVTFERRPVAELAEASEETEGRRPIDSDRVKELERQLQYTKESHQTTVEELETTNEELKSTNEELQSTNEELQSTNEELETSKEEMQSLNEEMETVNAELQRKVDELSRANDDMTNLLNATDIATLFLDNKLQIKRYTPQAERVIRVRHSDIGRPLGDLASRLDYHGLNEDCREVLRTLNAREAEVRSEGGTWFLMRILPYRTTENQIDGLVVTFVEISNVRALRESERRLLSVLQRSPTHVFGQDRELRYVWVGRDLFGRAREEVIGRTDPDLFGAANVKEMIEAKSEALKEKKYVRRKVEMKLDGEVKQYDLVVDPIREDDGEVTGISCVATDLTPIV